MAESSIPASRAAPEEGALPAPIPVGGVPVHPVGVDGLLDWARTVIASGARARVSYANAHNVLLARDRPAYRAALESADLVFCDGFGVWGASRWLGTPLPERMSPPDWIERLFALARAEGWPVFMLGGEAEVAALAARRVRERHPGLEVHAHHGYFEAEGAENAAVLRAIRAAAPALLLVGMGPPRQDLWIAANHLRHDAPLTIAVGSLFDYLAGTMRRGPHWLTSGGGEWLWRLMREPRRLWRRYLLGNPRFVWHIVRNGAGREQRGAGER